MAFPLGIRLTISIEPLIMVLRSYCFQEVSGKGGCGVVSVSKNRPLASLVNGSEMALSGGAQTGGVFSGPFWRFPASLNSVPAAVMSVVAGLGSCDQE